MSSHMRRARSRIAARRSAGEPVEVTYRPDGRPEIAGGRTLSVAHGAGLTLAVTATGVLGCDVETVLHRDDAVWDGLLGEHAGLARLVAADTGEDADTTATRVWTALECVQKSGGQPGGPLTLLPSPRPGWTVFGAGELRVAAFVTAVRGVDEPVVFAILTEGR
ncbi:hypothetical protein AB0869_31755 [Micromonospora vinacea]|uniref:hypothetical protein n=1 Tax=Micromonospora vinacea TaxID=709878 RepID=UPI003455C4FC